MDNLELMAKIKSLEKEVKRQSYFIDMQEIQMLQARYIYYLENGNIAEIWDDLFVHDDPEVRMEIMDSGAYIGPEHVKRAWYTMARRVDMDGNPVSADGPRMANTNTPNAMLFLMLTISTPIVVVEKDGQTAQGQWHIFGPHTNRVFDPQAMAKRDVAFWIAGKYDNEFVKVNCIWKIKKLRAICWMRSPFDQGWLKNADCRRTPSPYWPPDEPGRINSFNPDEGPNPDKWGPAPRNQIYYGE
jgi:hypothetical protein